MLLTGVRRIHPNLGLGGSSCTSPIRGNAGGVPCVRILIRFAGIGLPRGFRPEVPLGRPRLPTYCEARGPAPRTTPMAPEWWGPSGSRSSTPDLFRERADCEEAVRSTRRRTPRVFGSAPIPRKGMGIPTHGLPLCRGMSLIGRLTAQNKHGMDYALSSQSPRVAAALSLQPQAANRIG
jgi:hypothetical protein